MRSNAFSLAIDKQIRKNKQEIDYLNRLIQPSNHFLVIFVGG